MFVQIRPESTTDHEAIRALTVRAFSGLSFSDGSEPRVIDKLREAEALAVSLVAVVCGRCLLTERRALSIIEAFPREKARSRTAVAPS